MIASLPSLTFNFFLAALSVLLFLIEASRHLNIITQWFLLTAHQECLVKVRAIVIRPDST